MKLHRNARTTPFSRKLLVERIESGDSVRAAAEAVGVSRKYLPAYVAEFVYRFNRRRSPPDLFGWVTRRLMMREAVTLSAIQATADVCA